MHNMEYEQLNQNINSSYCYRQEEKTFEQKILLRLLTRETFHKSDKLAINFDINRIQGFFSITHRVGKKLANFVPTDKSIDFLLQLRGKRKKNVYVALQKV